MPKHTYSQETVQKIQRIINTMLDKAMKDPEFKTLALNDFGAAFKEITGSDLPDGTAFKFVPAGQGNLKEGLIEIPESSEELTDEDLEKVAGGTGGISGMPEIIAVAYGVPSQWMTIPF